MGSTAKETAAQGSGAAVPATDPVPPIPYLRLRARLVCEEPARLPPYKGSLLRGAFGHALRHTACAFEPTTPCRPCALRPTCAYPNVFEPLIEGEPPPFLRGLATAPRPYVFEPHAETDDRLDYAPGDPLGFDLLLLGEAVGAQAPVVLALRRMAAAGLGSGRRRFRLEEVTWEDAAGRFTPGYSAGQGAASHAWSVAAPPRLPPTTPALADQAVLRFLTPTRFKSDGRLADRFTFRDLVFRMLRRTLEIAHFHAPATTPDWHFHPYLEAASVVQIVHRDLRWHDWERWSNRQRTSMRLGGFVGEVRVEGPVGQFAPLLRTAEVLHVGKGTTFGLGRVEVGAGGGRSVPGAAGGGKNPCPRENGQKRPR